MGREKLKRQLQFKPICRHFAPEECPSSGTIRLLHEEMEALYLMDNQKLYQADAAERMGVSRPTFARIIKNAREKVSMMLISGARLVIEDEKEDYRVLITSSEEEHFRLGKPNAPFLKLYHIQHHQIIEEKTLDNPVFVTKVRPGQVLPALCEELKVNFFIATTVGAGLRSALLARGVYAYGKKSLDEKELLALPDAG